MTELAKYEGIYGSSDRRYAGYGHSNHGRDSVAIWDTWKVRSIVDVGCGHNEFLREVRSWPRPWGSLAGVDFACPSADVMAPATALPFADGDFDLVTGFDALEHLPTCEVDRALAEMARVASAFVVSISYAPSRITWQGANLHPTVRPEAWWIDRLRSAGAVSVEKYGRYLFGRWRGRPDVTQQGLPVAPGGSIVLVGNGPSVLQADGAAIDAHDEVVRFNAFKTAGFEARAGARTTAWCTCGQGVLPQDGVRPRRMIVRGVAKPDYAPAELWRIPMRLFRRLEGELSAAAGRQVMPSSGFLMLAWLIETGLPVVSLAGFDHFAKDESSQHHYWQPRAYTPPREHDGPAEAAVVARWAFAGRVQYLRSTPAEALRPAAK